jgi:hypothetical protein
MTLTVDRSELVKVMGEKALIDVVAEASPHMMPKIALNTDVRGG